MRTNKGRKWTKEERFEANKKEVVSILKEAAKNGLRYSDVRKNRLSTGTALSNFLNHYYQGGVSFCLEEGLPLEDLFGDGVIFTYYYNKLSEKDVTAVLKSEHTIKGKTTGLTKKEFGRTPYTRAVVAKSEDIFGSYSDALVEIGITPQIMSDDYIQKNKEKVLEMYLKGFSTVQIQSTTDISQTTIRRILKEEGIEARKPRELSKRVSNRGSVSAGYLFEGLLERLFKSLNISYKKYAHDILNPDFVLKDMWVDAKLTDKTSVSKTIKKYKDHTESVQIVYLIGAEKETALQDGSKISFYTLLNDLEDGVTKDGLYEEAKYIENLARTEYDLFDDEYSERNQEILRLVSDGYSYRGASRVVGVSCSTARNVCMKSGVKSSAIGGRGNKSQTA